MPTIDRTRTAAGARRLRERRGVLAVTSAVGVLAAMVLVVISGSTASAAVVVWTPGGACGSLQFTTVPDNVFSMSVVVKGGRGGRGGNQSSGEKGNPGDAGIATGTFAVTPGQQISARVGCSGVDGGDFDNSSSVPGWSSGGGSGRGWAFKPVTGGSGGSGGGSSAVCIGAACNPGAGTEVVVAGGGGGGGTSSCAGTAAGAGGAAGNQEITVSGSGSGPSGSNGLNGGNSGNNANGGVGGAGGINNAGGSPNGGTAPSEDGGFGSTTVVGGGGGGGYVGGKQGGNSQPLCRGGGGGGGGSTWVKSTGTDVTTNTHTGSAGVTVTFAEPIITTTSTSTSTSTSSTSSTSSTTTTTTTPPSNLGSIRLQSDPPVRTQIKIDGNIANSWGLDWVKVTAGYHGLCFSDVPGYTTPPCMAVNVAIGSVNERTAVFIQRGYLQVTTSPAVASQISVDGVPRDNWGLFADFEPGSHQVCFGAVAGYTPPPCQTVTVTAGTTTPVTGTFTPSAGTGQSGVGRLRVTTSPALPSQIVVDDVPRDRFGLDWMEIAPGPHTVCFTHVEGYTEPECQDVNVTAGGVATVVGTFTRRGFLQVFTSPALPGTISINGLRSNDWGLYTDLPVGTYGICFGFVTGRFTPACQQATVSAGQTTTITGTYG